MALFSPPSSVVLPKVRSDENNRIAQTLFTQRVWGFFFSFFFLERATFLGRRAPPCATDTVCTGHSVPHTSVTKLTNSVRGK